MKKLITLVALLFTVMISSTASAADWVWLYSDEYQTIYVDNNSIQRDYNYSGYVFRAFVKTVYNDAGRKRMIDDLRSSDITLPREIYNLSFIVELDYFKRANRMSYTAVMSAVFYDHDGNSIPGTGGSLSELQWEIISPDTINELMFYKIFARLPK